MQLVMQAIKEHVWLTHARNIFAIIAKHLKTTKRLIGTTIENDKTALSHSNH